jgi:hypothetical protein
VCQSCLTFAALMMGHHRAISAFCHSPSASGANRTSCEMLQVGSMPRLNRHQDPQDAGDNQREKHPRNDPPSLALGIDRKPAEPEHGE